MSEDNKTTKKIATERFQQWGWLQSARKYMDGVKEFVRDARVQGTQPPHDYTMDQEANQKARRRARSSTSPRMNRPVPRSFLKRFKGAMWRDWRQTINHLSRAAGAPMNQTALDTLRQLRGAQAIPRGEMPNVDEISIEDAREAQRLGYVNQFVTECEWDESLERELRLRWDANGHQTPFSQVRAQVYEGWLRAKADVRWVNYSMRAPKHVALFVRPSDDVQRVVTTQSAIDMAKAAGVPISVYIAVSTTVPLHHEYALVTSSAAAKRLESQAERDVEKIRNQCKANGVSVSRSAVGMGRLSLHDRIAELNRAVIVVPRKEKGKLAMRLDGDLADFALRRASTHVLVAGKRSQRQKPKYSQVSVISDLNAFSVATMRLLGEVVKTARDISLFHRAQSVGVADYFKHPSLLSAERRELVDNALLDQAWRRAGEVMAYAPSDSRVTPIITTEEVDTHVQSLEANGESDLVAINIDDSDGWFAPEQVVHFMNRSDLPILAMRIAGDN